MTYEELLEAADDLGLIAKEKDLQAHDGLIRGRRVAIRRSIPSQCRKACVLAEELGHYFTSAGDIMDPTNAGSRKQGLTGSWQLTPPDAGACMRWRTF